MGFYDLKCFELVKQKDGIYRCKGGRLADIVFLVSGVFHVLGLAIINPFRLLFGYFFNRR